MLFPISNPFWLGLNPPYVNFIKSGSFGYMLITAWTINRKAHLLYRLVPYLLPEQQQAVVDEAIKAVKESDIPFSIGDFYLKEYIPIRLKIEALIGAAPLGSSEDRQAILGEVLHMLQLLQPLIPSDMSWIMCQLAPLLPPELPELMEDALDRAMKIYEDWGQVESLNWLAPSLSQQPKIMAKALTRVKNMWGEWGKAEALNGLAPYLPAKLMGKALAIAQNIANEMLRVEVLIGMVPYLPMEQLSEAMAEIQAMGNEWSQFLAFFTLRSYKPAEIPQSLFAEALSSVRAIRRKTQTLRWLAPYLPPDFMGEGLAIAREITNEKWQAEALVGLAPHLPTNLLGDGLDIVKKIDDDRVRVKALEGMASRLEDWPEHQPSDAVAAWCTTLPVLASKPRPQFLNELNALLPFMFALAPEGQREAVAEEIFRAVLKVAEWWP